MKLLLLGGTGFLGHHIVEAALRCGHEVTLFHRGQTHPDLFPDLDHVQGDREKDLTALSGRYWDAAIDTCGSFPRAVRASAEFLASAVDHYTFISSLNAYAQVNVDGIDESYPVGTLPDETVEEVTNTSYGPLKALCEQAAEHVLPGRVLIIRPGLIVGPSDPTGRFTYWPRRLAQDGEVLVPDRKDQPVQFIDVRDLAEWNIRMVEANQTGIYNATGPAHRLTLQQLLEQCKTVSGSDTHLTWVSEAFLLEQEVTPWRELPLWIPRTLGVGRQAADIRKALDAGLTFRPLTETIHDTLVWDRAHPGTVVQSGSITPGREADLLHAWHMRIHE
jgi:2'-hydroxyisoflavone reductase